MNSDYPGILVPIAECLWDVCERFDLIGHGSMSPAYPGAFGVIADAFREDSWFALDCGTVPVAEATNERNRWCRLIAVLCSRLFLAEVSKLPGYDHNATEGPFGMGKERVS